MATRKSLHNGTSSVAAAAGESRAYLHPWYKRSDNIRSSGEEQTSHLPSWNLCMGGGIAEYWARPMCSYLENILHFQLQRSFVVVGTCHMRTEECRASVVQVEAKPQPSVT